MTLTGSEATDKSLAGFLAGALSTATLHPLDLIKTRLQLSEAKRQKGQTLQLIKQIYGSKGIHGLYRGLSANLAGSCASWGIYFLWYQSIKDRINPPLTAVHHLSASALAGFLTSLMTNPLWVVRTRMFAEESKNQIVYRHVFHGLRVTWNTEGVRGLYRGIVPALWGTSHGAVQFMVYEELKQWRANSHRDLNTQNVLEYTAMAIVSKIVAALTTYPLQVIRSRMHNEKSLTHPTYSKFIPTAIRIFKNEGWTALYKGLLPSLVRVLPGTCITFVTFESLCHLFKRL